jgi:hypothetical protein
VALRPGGGLQLILELSGTWRMDIGLVKIAVQITATSLSSYLNVGISVGMTAEGSR